MTAQIEERSVGPPAAEVPPPRASWPAPAAAFAVDVLPGFAVLVTAALVALTVPQRGPWWWVSVAIGAVAILLMAANRVISPAVTGWSLGRAIFGVTVVRRDGGAVGPWLLLLRDIAHLLDTATLLVGWAWPLWDARRRTFADLLLSTEVWRAHPRRPAGSPLRWTALVAVIAALVCAAGAATSYFVVYQRDRAGDHARAQIAKQGPKIVTEMLTYDPKTLADDFARARSLTTDNYREQLEAVQEQLQEGATPHTYWVPNSAVLSATTDQATVLMFLQGKAGAEENVQPISATVRVSFVKRDGRWLVDDLTFMPPPKPDEPGP